MIASIIAKLNTAVTKYKAQRVVNVIEAYTDHTRNLIANIMPVSIGFYEDAAKDVVAKTYADPQPAIDLLKALDAAAKHYGPGLKVLWDEMQGEFKQLAYSDLVLNGEERLTKTLEDIAEA